MYDESDNTILSGPVPDHAAALHGLLASVRPGQLCHDTISSQYACPYLA